MSAASAAPERLGRYRLVEKLGQGGMATVFLAEDEELRRTVALKLMHPFLTNKKEGVARFAREARAVAALRHPNVLAVYDYVAGDGDSPAYLVMECIRGPSLRRFLDDNGAPLPEVAAMVGCKVALALEMAHRAGIVHRDVKPENVLIDEGGRVVLCDFGVARMVSADGTMTATGALIGSPAYMSPEQAAGEDEVDGRSDLFSLGTMMYLLSTGAMPFAAKEPLALLGKIHRGDHKPPTAVNPRVPPFLERVIERCLRVDRTARWQTAAEIAAALEAGLRADGLGEVDRELTEYFRDPPAYNQAAEPRIVDVSLERAKTAAARGELATAIGLCNRVLAWRPDDRHAQTLLGRLGRRSTFRRWLVAAAALLVLAGGSAFGWRTWHRRAVVVPPPPTTTEVVPPPLAIKPELKPPPTEPPPLPATPNPPAVAIKARVPGLARHGRPAVEPTSASPAPSTLAPGPPPPPPAPLVAVEPVPVAEAKPTMLWIKAKPFCQGLLDGKDAIKEGKRPVSPGPHHIRCESNGRSLERDVVALDGETTVAAFDFLVAVDLRLKLSRGDQVAIGDGKPTANPPAQPSGSHRVRLFKQGAEVAHDYVDLVPPTCVLVDTPRLECRKP